MKTKTKLSDRTATVTLPAGVVHDALSLLRRVVAQGNDTDMLISVYERMNDALTQRNA